MTSEVMIPPADHPPILSPRIGVLVVNLGTPDAPDVASVKRYLLQFLSDRRVVEIFKRWGFAWGGDWQYTDPMHFELTTILTQPRA